MIQLELKEHDYIRNLNVKCQVSVERIVLDLQSEFMIGLCSIPTGGNIFTRFFCFHVVKPLLPIVALFAILVLFEKSLMFTLVQVILISIKTSDYIHFIMIIPASKLT